MKGTVLDDFIQHLQAFDGFSAKDDAACISVQPIAYGGLRCGMIIVMAIVQQGIIQGKFIGVITLGQYACRFVYYKDMLIFVDDAS